MIDFWNHNLNGITLFSKNTIVTNEKRNRKIKENYLSDGNLNGYITANEIRADLNIGAVKLQRMFKSIGIEPKYNRCITYYPVKAVQRIKDILNEPKQIPVIDKTGYISTQDLIQMFGYKDNKAFNIIAKNKMVKADFGGRVNYYKKDNAIEIFSKYKKK